MAWFQLMACPMLSLHDHFTTEIREHDNLANVSISKDLALLSTRCAAQIVYRIGVLSDVDMMLASLTPDAFLLVGVHAPSCTLMQLRYLQ